MLERCVFRARRKAACESSINRKTLLFGLKKRVDRSELLLEGQRRTWLLMTVVDDAGVTPLTLPLIQKDNQRPRDKQGRTSLSREGLSIITGRINSIAAGALKD